MTYTPPTVTAPASLPWDADALTARALDVLRLEPSDVDGERVAAAVTEACALIDHLLDIDADELLELGWLLAENIPTPVTGAAVMLSVELYRRPAAPFGVLDSWGTDGIATRVPTDAMRSVRSILGRYKSRRGIA